MKKSILIFCAVFTILSLTAFGLINRSLSTPDTIETFSGEEVATNTKAPEKINKRIFSDFIYDVGPRFNAIKKEDLDDLKSYSDLIGQEHMQRIVSYKSLSVKLLDGDRPAEIKEITDDGVFSAAQIDLLQSANYSTNIAVRADYDEKWPESGLVEASHWTPNLTVIPAKQAEYVSGKDALIIYLQEHSKDSRTGIQADKLQPAKLFFTVSKEGVVKNVRLDRTSNFHIVDETMVTLISNAPGKWQPAENSKGEKVDQELVISFGLMGC
jgi:hypothetical protein